MMRGYGCLCLLLPVTLLFSFVGSSFSLSSLFMFASCLCTPLLLSSLCCSLLSALYAPLFHVDDDDDDDC